jgi:transcriptional regulator with XRE-family HTH domain
MSFALPKIVTGGNMSPRRLATVLKQLRDDAKMTQEELAKRAKVARSYVALIEAGRKKNPSLDILKRLARALGVSVAELLE